MSRIHFEVNFVFVLVEMHAFRFYRKNEWTLIVCLKTYECTVRLGSSAVGGKILVGLNVF